MKTKNFVKILTLVLSLVLITCAVVGITAAAEDTHTNGLKGASIIHGDKIFIAFAVDVAEADFENVRIEYVWDGEETVHTASYYADEKVNDTYPAFVTEGIAAYDLGKQLTVTAYYNGEQVGESKTYSVAQYLYTKLYEDKVTGSAKECYEALLAYGAASQAHLEAGPALAVDELVCVYSTKEGTKVNADDTFYFNANATSATVVPSFEVSEGWVIAGWYATYLDGTVVEFELGDEIVITGTADLRPTLQKCVDADPKDHICDLHGETLSECADKDKNHECDICGAAMGDHADGEKVDHVCDYCEKELADLHADGNDANHNCDVCQKLLCADENNDFKCDTCYAYYFEQDTITTVNGGIEINNIAANSGTDYTADSNTISTSSRPSSHTKGTWLYLTTDPTNAANQVLASNSVSAGSMTDDAISDVYFTPSVVVEGGDLIVLEFDYYVDGCTNNKNSIKFVYNYANEAVERKNGTYVTSAGVRLINDADGSNRFALDTWVKVRVVCDNTNKKIYHYLSADSGATYTLVETVDNYASNGDKVATIGFTYIGYGVASTQYYDNIICIQTNAATSGIVFK